MLPHANVVLSSKVEALTPMFLCFLVIFVPSFSRIQL